MDKKLYILLFLFISFALIRCDNDDDDDNQIYDEQYDYIVLGAGTSGSVVASKLSNYKKNKVLLVEEGGYAQHPWIWDPHNWALHFLFDPEPVITRMFFTPPEAGVNNRTMALWRARVAGGCHSHNGMVVVVGESSTYDEWASITNENAWNWSNVRSKHIEEIRSKFYLRKLDDNRPLLPELKSSLLHAGLTFRSDIYSGNLQGFANRVVMSKPDNQTFFRRETTYSNYIDPVVATRSNLDVLVYHRAEKIVFNGNRAKYIRLRDVGTGKLRIIKIKKELIVSLGAYESPMLLQASGVGDPVKLSQLGITTNIASPYVGSNLVNHIYLQFTGKPVRSNVSAGIDLSAFERHSSTDGYQVFGHRANANTTKIEYALGTDLNLQGDGKLYFDCSVELFGPSSVGQVRISQLNQNGAAVQPLINSNFLSEKRDVDILTAGLKECRRIQNQLVNDGILDGTQAELSSVGQSDAEIESYIRNSVFEGFHPHASIRMGRSNDNKAPLDPRLKLKGSSNIRVVDASSLPSVFQGNTNTPSIVIALQASDFILNDN